MQHISTHFYENLFARDQESAIVNDTKRTKNTIWKLFNEIYELDKDAHKKKKENVRTRKLNKIQYIIEVCFNANNLIYSNC